MEIDDGRSRQALQERFWCSEETKNRAQNNVDDDTFSQFIFFHSIFVTLYILNACRQNDGAHSEQRIKQTRTPSPLIRYTLRNFDYAKYDIEKQTMNRWMEPMAYEAYYNQRKNAKFGVRCYHQQKLQTSTFHTERH